MGAVFSVVEQGKEIELVGSILRAAVLWSENPTTRRIRQVINTGQVGENPWLVLRQVPEAELLDVLGFKAVVNSR